MLAFILVAVIVLFWIAFKTYGHWMSRVFGLDDRHVVLSEGQYDGVDHVPTKTQVLLGHHFSSIAGAGPIVGPILAGLFFGSTPTGDARPSAPGGFLARSSLEDRHMKRIRSPDCVVAGFGHSWGDR